MLCHEVFHHVIFSIIFVLCPSYSCLDSVRSPFIIFGVLRLIKVAENIVIKELLGN